MSKHRLCLLGDSHAAALLMGWRLVEAEFSDLEVHVFAAPGDRIRATAARGRAIIARRPTRKGWLTRNGVDRIAIDAYDGFIVAGFGTSVIKQLGLLRSHVLFGYGRENRRRQLVSPEVLAATVHDRLIRTKPFRWAHRFQRLGGRPVFYVPTPRSASSVKSERLKGRWPFGLGDQEMVAFAGCVDRAAETLCSEIGMVLLRQPSSTLESPLFTNNEYRRDNDTSPIKRKAGMDPVHMNAAFGEVVWRTHLPSILAELNAAGPRGARPKRAKAKAAKAKRVPIDSGAALTRGHRRRAGPAPVPVD